MLAYTKNSTLRMIFLFIGIVLVAHQITPHHHHSAVSEKEHQEEHLSASTFIEFLQLAFHQELGAEDETISEKTTFKLNLVAPVLSTNILPTFQKREEVVAIQSFTTPYNNRLNKRYTYLFCGSFRAPPTHA